MPIPVRAHSPVKANSAVSSVSSASTIGNVPQNKPRGAKEPTRLTRGPAASRGISGASERRVNDSKPGDPGVMTKANINTAHGGTLPVSGHSRTQSSTRNASTTRTAADVPGEAADTTSSQLQHGLSTINAVDFRVPASKTQIRALGASSRPRIVGTQTWQEATTKSSDSVASGAITSTGVKAPLSVSEKAPAMPSKKQTFNAYQQHYSPKKSTSVPAPSDSTTRPRSADRVIPLTQIVSYEDELLQLSLIHKNSTATLQAYETSINSQLKTGYKDVEMQLSALKSLQRDRQANINALGVSEWLQKERQTQDEARAGSDTLLLLAHCLKELQEVSEDDGPLDLAMKIFDEWCSCAFSGRSSRYADKPIHGEEAGYFLRPIHGTPQWAALVSSVQDRVRACAKSLADLQRPPEASSIGLLIKVHSLLAEQILQEIAICRSIEGLIVRDEQEWVEGAVEDALCVAELHHSVQTVQASTRRGIWEHT